MQDHNKLTSRRRGHRAVKAIQFGLMVSFEFFFNVFVVVQYVWVHS